MTIRINDAHAIRLIADRAMINLGAKVYCIAEYDSEDRLTGGVLVMNDNGWSCEIHTASFRRNWATREFIWSVFNYIFRVRGIKKLFGRVPEGNTRARRLNANLGFTEEAIINDVFPGGEGLIVMSMYADDCRFLNMKLPIVEFASPDKTNIIEVHEYSQEHIGS